MAKFYSGLSQLSCDWNQVAAILWTRYPNPYSKHVLTEDTLSREVRDSKLYTKRVITKTNHLPKWGERFVTARFVTVVEESVVDPVARTVTTYTRNLGYQRIMSVEERCVYKPSTDGEGTVIERQAWIDSHLFGFSRALKMFGHERFKNNIAKTMKGLQYVIDRATNPREEESESRASRLPSKGELRAAGEAAKDSVKDAATKAKRKVMSELVL
ncbi:PREDICTED: PRELI domain-containing protein 1, mitochondrial-like [Priapulus caudatus]|uniref:PRELI domain-containing protein 1, mitochondrial-like n=1 Tax=Priapulus caudatus TaxID=37621 RepID=A0ABM1EED6_PRICU|nr:PREDICTED: PRELI domain-containing protein 1, mitochondrial-like [Priapulus caudatus]